MREHLLGYLIGALEPHETEELENSLSQDDRLRRELDSLRHCLHPLTADAGHYDPPDGLAARTCRLVASRTTTTVRMATSASRTWRAADLVVAACVLVAGTLVFFPAVSYSRFQAEMAGCQNNLRQIGQGFGQYAQYHGGFFPQLPTSGNEAVAGLHAPILREAGYVESDLVFACPGWARPTVDFRIPKRSEVRVAAGEKLDALWRALGGAYAFTLGYVDNGRYTAVRNRNRATFALVADTPNLRLSNAQSPNHRSRGQNVLFEDLHVKFLPTCQACPLTKDDFYHNDDGEVAAGKHANDSVVGPSHVPPLGSAGPAGSIAPTR